MQAYLFFRLPVCLFSNILFDAVSVPLLSSLCLFSVMQPFIFVRPFVKISLSFYVVSFIFHSFSISFLAFTCHLLDLVFNCIHYLSSVAISAHKTKTCSITLNCEETLTQPSQYISVTGSHSRLHLKRK